MVQFTHRPHLTWLTLQSLPLTGLGHGANHSSTHDQQAAGPGSPVQDPSFLLQVTFSAPLPQVDSPDFTMLHILLNLGLLATVVCQILLLSPQSPRPLCFLPWVGPSNEVTSSIFNRLKITHTWGWGFSSVVQAPTW